MNKPKMTVYVSDSNFVPSWVLDKVLHKEGFRVSTNQQLHEFLIHVVGITYPEQIEDSHIDFQCMLDHIWDVELEDLAHEPIRTVEVTEDMLLSGDQKDAMSTDMQVHQFIYYAPNSIIEVRYVYPA